MVKSGITEDELIGWGGREVFNQALALCNSGDVADVEYDDDTLEISGKIIRPDGWGMPVSLKLEPKGRIRSKCPCYQNKKLGQVCAHVVAIALARMVQEMDDEPSAAARTDGTPGGAEDGAAGEEEEGPYIEVPAEPGFYLFVSGSPAALSATLDAWYGDIDFPACSVQNPRTVYMPCPSDPGVRYVRNIERERMAAEMLLKFGFENGYSSRDKSLHMSDMHNVLNFLGQGIPELRRRRWKVDLSEKLEKAVDAMPGVIPVVCVTDAPGGAIDVSYRFETSNGSEVTAAEVQVALNASRGFIMRDGSAVLLDGKAVEAMHSVFRDCASSQDGAAAGWFRVRDVHGAYVRSALSALEDVIEIDASRAKRWLEASALRNRDADAKFEPVSLGALDKVLRPYQKQGVYWMRFLERAGFSGLLADEMGLGKTLQTLAWLSLPPEAGHGKGPSLIVCPTSLVRNWQAEAEKFTPWLKTLVVSGAGREAAFGLIGEADIVVTSYALLQRDFEAAYADKDFSAVVLDEAQHIKNRQTKNAKSVKMLSARRRLVLTGTPVENSVADVWSIFDFLMPGYLGDYETFRLKYEQTIADGGDRAEEALERLKRKIRPFMLRRLKQTVAKDLPDKIVKTSWCPMDEDSRREYSALLASARRSAGDMIKAKGFAKSKFELLALLMKLRRCASMGKLPSFMEQLESAIAGGHKILVFSQFVKTLAAIADCLNGENIKFCYLDGSTKDRLGECNRFNRDPSIPVFLVSLMAGGTGLNLTGADMVMHYDPWWNPAVEAQATDRAHRIGQKKNVFVVKMIASGTVEEKVLALQRKKEAVIAATVSTTDAQIMEKMTADDFAQILG